MTEPTFMTDEALVTIKCMHSLRKALLKYGQMYRSQLFNYCHFRGITEEQFDGILEGLAASQWCTLSRGELGGVLVTINPAVREEKEGAVYRVFEAV